ncbi:arabinosyltransferase domain-containing protein [Williamsia sp. CHRR-6]|uniref:arabinosyltransferase domain-containing protein n=1 Tax=Williamsia sp. CHRR-6 TaxID=2835871 RepID=UPI001BDAF0DB|nr:arabinosyltransferase domain-containing protein [Williamsia sp. CHRR-6]MBT0567559.1 arabinosyltransferase domain-containing protein [Williamsia sp. CHRR-6]
MNDRIAQWLRGNDYRRVKWTATIAGLLGFLLAVAAPILPVKQTTAEMSWPQGPVGNVVAPLVAFVPVDLDITVPCARAAELPRDGGMLLSTIPADGGDAAARGLFIRASRDTLSVVNRGVVLLTTDRAAAQSDPDCAIVIRSDGTATRAQLRDYTGSGQLTFDVADANLRPQIVGVYTDLPSSAAGLSLHATIDTRFVSTPTTLKFLGLVAGVALTIISLMALGILDTRDGRARRRFLPAGWWRVRPLDLIVIVTLGLWWFLGSNTSDDGYNFTVGRVAAKAGYADNYYRYFGVPQDPFGWHYQVISAMTKVSLAAPWMRLPAFILGVLGWWIISREVIPRLGRTVRHSTPALWTAAGVFLAIWLPLNNGLRPEPAMAVGALLTWCSVDRSIATGRLLPLALAAVFASFTLALAPGGLMAVAALLAGVRPLINRVARRRHRDGVLPLLAPILAAGTAVLYEIFADQTLSGVLTASTVSSTVGPTLEWWQEPVRFYYLMLPTVDGSLSRRFGVLMMLLCLALVLLVMLRRRAPQGVARGPVWRLIAVMFGTMFFMAFTPTKWTHHFGVYAGIAGGLAAAAGAMAAPALLRRRRNRTLLAAAVLFVTGIAFTGTNGWWFVGSYGVPWWDRAPAVGGVKVGWMILTLALAVAAVGLWQHFRDDYVPESVRRGEHDGGSSTAALRDRLGGAAMPAIIALVVFFEVASMIKGAYVQRNSFSWASSNARALTGNSCGMANDVLVEQDPNSGLLAPAAVAGQRGLTPGAALAGTSAGFTPNGVPDDLSVDSTEDSATASAQNTAQNSAGAGDDTSGSDSVEGGTGGGQGARGVNGSTVRLPFGLSPARTPVLGSYGGPGGTLSSAWYQMPPRSSKAPLLAVSVAGAVQGTDKQGVIHPGQSLVVEYGRVGAGGRVIGLGTRSPIDIADPPIWRNLRFPLDEAPRAATVARIVASDVSGAPDQWLAITPPRITTMRTLNDVVGRTDPVFIDWLPAFVFPCQQPMYVRNGVAQVPRWRIMPDANATRQNSQTWMSGKAGGPLGLSEALLRPTLLPTYLRNDWGNDWGSLQKFSEIDPAPVARLQIGTATRSGLWDPAPMRAVGY